MAAGRKALVNVVVAMHTQSQNVDGVPRPSRMVKI
jgi:hypothetical protein